MTHSAGSDNDIETNDDEVDDEIELIDPRQISTPFQQLAEDDSAPSRERQPIDQVVSQYVSRLSDVEQAADVLQLLVNNASLGVIRDSDELRRLELLSGFGIAYDATFLWSQIDELADEDRSQYFDLSFTVGAITSAGTLGYILWSLRGGVLIATALSQLPSWRFIDPLPVLENYKSKTDKRSTDGIEGFFE